MGAAPPHSIGDFDPLLIYEKLEYSIVKSSRGRVDDRILHTEDINGSKFLIYNIVLSVRGAAYIIFGCNIRRPS